MTIKIRGLSAPLAILLIFLLASSCRKPGYSEQLDSIEAFLLSRPDSALTLLRESAPEGFVLPSDKARYAILLAMAADRNGDTICRSDLKLALDYYSKFGSPDDRLRVYYLLGKSYLDEARIDSALMCFFTASHLNGVITDSLTLAHVYLGEGEAAQDYSDLAGSIKSAGLASRIFAGNPLLSKERLTASAVELKGHILAGDTRRADSLAGKMLPELNSLPEYFDVISPVVIAYLIDKASDKEVRGIISKLNDGKSDGSYRNLSIAMAYYKIGDFENALEIIKTLSDAKNPDDSLEILSLKYKVLTSLGRHKEALWILEEYTVCSRRLNELKASQAMNLARDSQLLRNEKERLRLNRDIVVYLCSIAILALIAVAFRFYILSGRISRERDQLRLTLCSIEEEKGRLQQIIDRAEASQSKDEHEAEPQLSARMRTVLLQRIDLLNSILAEEITSNKSHSRPFSRYAATIHNDKIKFLKSTAEAFSSSHPQFMAILTSSGLSEKEVEIVCLYALGLSGKEIGSYLEIKGFYNVSSNIRSKLGLNQKEGSLAAFVRNLLNQDRIE